MKKFGIALSLILALCLIFAGCGSVSTDSDTNQTLSVTAEPTIAETQTLTGILTTIPNVDPSTDATHEHSFADATCTDPQTCTICGETSGSAAGHVFTAGVCTTCGTADPSYTDEPLVWIPTKGGIKYHTHADCSNMDGPIQVTQSEAEAQGFTKCKRCYEQ